MITKSMFNALKNLFTPTNLPFFFPPEDNKSFVSHKLNSYALLNIFLRDGERKMNERKE